MRKNWLLGFGFFSISLTWGLYNAFVPLFLDQYLKSAAMIGFMMTLDNYFAMFLQPWIGHRSDSTVSKFGPRLPYLMWGMPIAAIFVMLLPLHSSLLTLILFMVLMNLAMSIYRSPTIALMPDITPEAQRTKANGIINFMGGVGGILAFGAGSILYGANPAFPFIASGIVTLLCLFILYGALKGRYANASQSYTRNEEQPKLGKSKVLAQLDKTTVLLLIAIFFWFVAYQGVEALFTLYGKNYLGLTDQAAAFSLTFFSLFFVLFAIPSGWLGNRFGKRNMIITGICGLIVVFSVLPFVQSLIFLRVLLAIGGAFWACININSYPFVISLGNEASIGTRTGLYYLVSSLAAVSSPPLLGLVVDRLGYGALFGCAATAMVIAFVLMLLIPRHHTVSEDITTVKV